MTTKEEALKMIVDLGTRYVGEHKPANWVTRTYDWLTVSNPELLADELDEEGILEALQELGFASFESYDDDFLEDEDDEDEEDDLEE